MADLLLLGFIAGFARGGWSTGFLRRLVGLAYIALSFVVGAYLRLLPKDVSSLVPTTIQGPGVPGMHLPFP